MNRLIIENVTDKELELVKEWCELRSELTLDLIDTDWDKYKVINERYTELSSRVSSILLVSAFIQYQETGL